MTELVTPPLDGMILPGVTRDSVLALAREHASGKAPLNGMPEGKFVVNERPVTMKEVKEAAAKGQLVEFFGTGAWDQRVRLERFLITVDRAGTAAVISPVDRIGYLGEDLHIPVGPDGMGPVSRPIWKQLVGIQTGKISHPWSVVVE